MALSNSMAMTKINNIPLNNGGIPNINEGNMNMIGNNNAGLGILNQNPASPNLQSNAVGEQEFSASSNLAKVESIVGNLGTTNLPNNFPGSNINMNNMLGNNLNSMNMNLPNKIFQNPNLFNNMASTNLAQNMVFQKFPNNMANPVMSRFTSSMTKLTNSPTDIASIVNMATNFGNPFANSHLENPYGMQIQTEALEIAGTVAVNGRLPITGTVALQGNFPTYGSGTVNYECF